MFFLLTCDIASERWKRKGGRKESDRTGRCWRSGEVGFRVVMGRGWWMVVQDWRAGWRAGLGCVRLWVWARGRLMFMLLGHRKERREG